MANIQNYLNQIKTAVFGKDVRESIHDAIKQCYDDASINHDNANMEVKLARGSHNTLNDRLDENEKNQENLSSQLDSKTNLGYFYKEKEKEYSWNRNATLEEYYELFDSLATPSKLNYTVLGKDQSNTYDIRLYDYRDTLDFNPFNVDQSSNF